MWYTSVYQAITGRQNTIRTNDGIIGALEIMALKFELKYNNSHEIQIDWRSHFRKGSALKS